MYPFRFSFRSNPVVGQLKREGVEGRGTDAFTDAGCINQVTQYASQRGIHKMT